MNMNQKQKMTLALLVAATLAVPLVTGVALKLNPSSTQKLERSVLETSQTTIDWTISRIGQDLTMGTPDDPMAQDVEDLRDSGIAHAPTDALLPQLQEKQRGFVNGTVHITADMFKPIAFWIEPGDGWFPSLDREAGEAPQPTGTNQWTARQTSRGMEFVTLQADCIDGQVHDMLAPTLALNSLERYTKGGNHDNETAGNLMDFRDDRIGFGIVGQPGICNIVIKFMLEFVHEAHGFQVQAAADTGYVQSIASAQVCLEYDAEFFGCVPGKSRTDTINVEVLYAPVLPLAWAMHVPCQLDPNRCCDTDLTACAKRAVLEASVPSSANFAVINNGIEFLIFVFDVNNMGVAEGHMYHLYTLEHQAATGNGYQMALI